MDIKKIYKKAYIKRFNEEIQFRDKRKSEIKKIKNHTQNLEKKLQEVEKINGIHWNIYSNDNEIYTDIPNFYCIRVLNDEYQVCKEDGAHHSTYGREDSLILAVIETLVELQVTEEFE